jgi:hypothetical protein
MSSESQKASQPSKRALTFGYCTGLVLAFLALLACFVFLGMFLYNAMSSINARAPLPDHAAAMARLGLQGCGVMAGIAFGFLGFSLFLLGIKGESDVTAGNADWKLNCSRMAPGTLVVLASCTLVYLCVTYAIPAHLAPRAIPNANEK